ncbi:mismatch repair ATPase [Saccharomycopsis crataegensis]|uniref:DNA mismatch repair protein MSH2 n=1 Tax=Saccharomycopsis crataegensis TaxID=43959 RepID=A0AAV5QIR8_9ASCO|nr:mismatch repair ATPase [Saccharomycopsis crataegensis]
MSAAKIDLKFSDNADQNGFYRKYKNLDDKPLQTLRISDRGEYYTVLGEDDTSLVAEMIYKTRSVIKENQNIPYITISPQVFSSVVKNFVIDQGYKIELYDKQWRLLKNISPGNLQDVEELVNLSSADMTSNQMMGALKFMDKSDGKYIGLGYVDNNSKILGYAEFIDNDLFSNLESTLIQLNIREVLISGLTDESLRKDRVLTKLVQVINRCEITISDVKPSIFSTKDIDQDFNKLLTEESFLAFSTPEVQSKTLALSGVAALVAYLNLLNDDTAFGAYHLNNYTLGKYMKLDLSAVKALNLFPTVRDQGSKSGSIFGILNHCKSAEGTRLLSQWIKQPLTNLEDITKRHLLVGFLMEDSQTRSAIQQDVLSFVPDIRRLTRKFAKGKSTLEDVVRIYQLLLKLPDLLNILEMGFENLDDQRFSFLNDGELPQLKKLVSDEWLEPLKQTVSSLYKLQELVETTVDLDALDNHEYVIKAEFNEDLMEIKEKLDTLQNEITQCHVDTADQLQKEADKKLKLENHATHGWCMRLTRNDASVIRGLPKYHELQTVKAGVFFTTSQLKSVADQYTNLQGEYNRTQTAVVREIIEICSTYCPLLDKLSGELAEIDVIVAFAHVSSYAPTSYIRPKLYTMDDPQGKTIVKDARHPCLEMQDDISFIANDIDLAKNQSEFLIITGPNMGGKSTYIKSVGIINLLAQIGCYVPASEAEICLVDAILARVGAGDSQLKGISTFMAEMLEMSSILKSATEHSLIIIDELGRGTSTYDGFGLAYSISEHLAKEKHCFTLFATHFHELTGLSEKIPTVKNLHVVAHVSEEKATSDDITLLYKVEPGISDQSFGIHVAEVVQFPKKIISMSKRKASELEDLAGKAEGSAEDPYVADKRTKCNPEEITKGSQLLKTILKEWKTKVDLKKISETDAIKELNLLVKSTYGDEVKQDKFLQEVLGL